MHTFRTDPSKNLAAMIRTQSQKQLTLAEFEWPLPTPLDQNNRWVKLSDLIPWDELAEAYYGNLSSTQGRPLKDARLVIGAVIIKHKLNLSDREAVAQIQENPYLQFFVGLPGYQMKPPFAPSLFVEIRKRMGQQVFDEFQDAIVGALATRRTMKTKSVARESKDSDDDPPPTAGPDVPPDSDGSTHQGKLILDATVAPQAIRYPTDLSLLNEAREFSEQIIDHLYCASPRTCKP